MRQIEIALASENNYFCGLLVTASSIARFANNSCRLSFTILDAGISDDNYGFFVNVVGGLHGNSVFNRVHITDDVLKDFPDWHGNKAAYARLLLPEVMPPSVSHVIYCDVDFLWQNDIGELWDLRDDVSPFITTKDANSVVKESEEAWYKSSGYTVDVSRYFCTGLSFFNLDIFRKENLALQAIEFVKRHPDVGSADQTALNAVLNGRQRLVDSKWQTFSRDSPVEDIDPPCVVHYAGDPPWKISRKSHMLTDVQLLWFRFDASVRGISVWKSLRRHYTGLEIIVGRLVFLTIIKIPFFRALFNAFMKSTGRWPFYESMTRPHFKRVMGFLTF